MTKMRSAFLLGPITALVLGGCAVNPTTGQATFDPTQLGTSVKAVVCGLSASQSGVNTIENQQYQGKPLVNANGQQITSIIYVADTVACNLLGALPIGTTTVPTTAVTPVAVK